MEQSNIDLSSLDVRPFDCLVHLASSLLHPKDIFPGPTPIQTEDILHSFVTSPLYVRLHFVVPSYAMVSVDASSQPLSTVYPTGSSGIKQHVW